MSKYIFKKILYILLYYCIFISCIFSKIASADEVIFPAPPPKKSSSVEEMNLNQYGGDHSKSWYRGQNSHRSKRNYIDFALSYSIPHDIGKNDLEIPNVKYDGSTGEELGRNYSGTINFKGSMGANLSYGRQSNRLAIETELFYSSITLQDFTLSYIPYNANKTLPSSSSYSNAAFSVLGVTPNITLFLLDRKHSVIPYIKGGYGYAMYGVSNKEYKGYFNYGGGVSFRINPSMEFNLSYRVVDLGEVEYNFKPSLSSSDQNATNPILFYKHKMSFETVQLGYKFSF